MWLSLANELMSYLSGGSIKSQWAIFPADCHNSGRLWGRYYMIARMHSQNSILKSHMQGTTQTKQKQFIKTQTCFKVSNTHVATRSKAGTISNIYRLVSISFIGRILNELYSDCFTNCWGKMLTVIKLLAFQNNHKYRSEVYTVWNSTKLQ